MFGKGRMLVSDGDQVVRAECKVEQHVWVSRSTVPVRVLGGDYSSSIILFGDGYTGTLLAYSADVPHGSSPFFAEVHSGSLVCE